MPKTKPMTFVYDGVEFNSYEEMNEYTKTHEPNLNLSKEDHHLYHLMQNPGHEQDVMNFLVNLKEKKEPMVQKTIVTHMSDDDGLSKDQAKIKAFFENFSKFLVEKNRRYGNSVAERAGIFFKGNNLDGIRIRLDDKIAPIQNSAELRPNDLQDLIGYLSLLCVQLSNSTGDQVWIEPQRFLD